MGATKGSVDRVKFGQELRAVVESITQLQPDLIVRTDGATGKITTRSTTLYLLLMLTRPLVFVGSVQAQLQVDERETTEIALRIVGVAEKNGLKLPREFGLVLKQVHADVCHKPCIWNWKYLNVTSRVFGCASSGLVLRSVPEALGAGCRSTARSACAWTAGRSDEHQWRTSSTWTNY